MAPWWAQAGTEVLFTPAERRFNFLGEQFWGRAARASADSKESGRLLIFSGEFLRQPFVISSRQLQRLISLQDFCLGARISHAKQSTTIPAHEFSLAQDVILH